MARPLRLARAMSCAVRIYRTPEDLADAAAEIVGDQLRRKPASVLGLPTGRTPLLMYRDLAWRHQADGLSFAEATVFALDEYYGLPAGHPQSFRAYLEQHLIRQIDVDPARFQVPRSDAPSPQAEAEAYERRVTRAGGIDLAILGLGRNGHIGFNEPGSFFESRTRQVDLTPETVDRGRAPTRQAITLGIATILSARRVVLLATGVEKAPVVRDALLGPITTELPVSALRRHPECLFLLDEAAAHRFLAAYRRLAEQSA